jgi:hypothetical protein
VSYARTGVAVLALAGGALLIGIFGRVKPEAPPATAGFAFCAGQAADAKKVETSWSYPLVFGLLTALPAEQTTSLARAVSEANRRWETRGNPFVEDLEDSDPDEALATWMKHAPPAAATALAAAHKRYCGTDGWCVTVVSRATPCPKGTEPTTYGQRAHDRARFLAWPFGHALWLRAKTAEEAALAAAALRSRATSSDLVGLVLHAGDDERTRTSLGDLREALVRHEVLRRKATEGSSEGDAPDAARPFRVSGDGGAGGQGSFPAEMGPLDIVVLPRLPVVDRPRVLEDEVRTTAPALWILTDRGALLPLTP